MKEIQNQLGENPVQQEINELRGKASAKKWFPFQRELPPFFYSESKAAIRCLEKNHHCWELIDSDLDLSQAEYSP